METIRNLAVRARAFLHELQRSDERRKRNWLIATSSVCVALVFLLWIMYLKVSLPSVEMPTSATTTPVAAAVEAAEEDSFFETIGRGFSVVQGKVEESVGTAAADINALISGFRERLSSQNTFVFEIPTSSIEREAPGSIPSTPIRISE